MVRKVMFSRFLVVCFLVFGCGTDGKDGHPGFNGTDGQDGIDGKDGVDGKSGIDGKNGESHSLEIQNILRLINAYKQSVVNIECTDGLGSWWSGTGAKVSKGILTAHHVIDGATGCNLYSEGIYIGFGTTFIQNGKRDQALITPVSFNAKGLGLLDIPYDASIELKVGDMLLLLSHPYDLRANLQLTFGFVTSEKESFSNYWSDIIMTDMVANSGSSGGPVFDKRGKIVAIHVGGYNTTNLDLNYTLLLHPF